MFLNVGARPADAPTRSGSARAAADGVRRGHPARAGRRPGDPRRPRAGRRRRPASASSGTRQGEADLALLDDAHGSSTSSATSSSPVWTRRVGSVPRRRPRRGLQADRHLAAAPGLPGQRRRLTATALADVGARAPRASPSPITRATRSRGHPITEVTRSRRVTRSRIGHPITRGHPLDGASSAYTVPGGAAGSRSTGPARDPARSLRRRDARGPSSRSSTPAWASTPGWGPDFVDP